MLQARAANDAATSFIQDGKTYWSYSGLGQAASTSVSWFIAGTPPNWQGTPLVLVAVVEENNPVFVQKIGDELINKALNR